MVEPHQAYVGEKDYQQIAGIRIMFRQLNLPVRIVSCPIVRETDGLALSSRNVRLTDAQRKIAPVIAATLKESCTFVPTESVQEVTDRVIRALNAHEYLRVEYYTIVDGESLLPLTQWSDSKSPVGCIAVFCGEVRLIDNIKYNNQ